MMIGLLLHLMRPAAFSLQFHLSVFTFPAHLCRDFLLCCAKRWTVEFSSLPGGKLQTKRKDTKEKTSVSFGAEGETRTLAPVARPTPLAGAPRHQLEYFSVCDVISHDIQLNAGKMQVDYRGLSACNMAEKVGFEPTVPFGITGFQDRLLKPLGHLSSCLLRSVSVTRSIIISLLFTYVNNIFQLFLFFYFS